VARPVAYGLAFGKEMVVRYPTQASVGWEARGGKFVAVQGGNRRVALASALTVTDIIGWANVGTHSSSSTAGNDIVPVNVNDECVYEMPINITRTESQLVTMRGKTCDLVVTSGIQQANVTGTTTDQIQIVDYKYYGAGTGEQSVLVRLYKHNLSNTTSV